MLNIKDVTKGYKIGNDFVPVLSQVNLRIHSREVCALMGSSGSGKTTLMNLVGLLDRPDHGQIQIDGLPTENLSDDEMAALRNQRIGFVFQAFHLLPRLSALDNVSLPLVYRGLRRPIRRSRAAAMLQHVGLAERASHRPDEMSGGQRQRLAIARALVGQPSLLLADEPTGNLDSRGAEDIMALFLAINRDLGVTILIVTHDPAVAACCPRRIIMRDGRVHEDDGEPNHPGQSL